MDTTQVVIIGCGPAGLAAAIQLRRHGITPLVFEKERIGGLLVNAHLVENYPGFPGGISGPDLVGMMHTHLERYSIDVVSEEVTHLAVSGGAVTIKTAARSLKADAAIIASGTRPRSIEPLEIPDGLADRILHEIHPIRQIGGKSVLIVGSGDAAFDYALSLGAYNRVTIANRSCRVKCLPVLWDRVQASPGIQYVEETEPVGVAAGSDDRLEVTCRTPDGDRKITADYVIFATGRDPELGFMSKETVGHLEDLGREGVLHLIGDVVRGNMRQTAIAVGDGVMAAMKVHRRLMEAAL